MRRLSLALVALLVLTVASARGQSDVPAAAALSRTLPDVRFDAITLEDAMEFLRDASGANLHVNWRALETAAIDRNTTVTVQLRRVPLKKVLKTVLNEAAPGMLAWYVEQNVIHVTTREIADEQMITRVYPVQDLLLEIPDFQGPDFNIGQGNGGGGGSGFGGGSGGGSGRGGGGGGGGLFGGGGGNSGNNDDEDEGLTREERAQQIVDLITETIRPDIWQVNGGRASIRYFNGHLVITAPRSVQGVMSGE
jgi:hypothetical protein